MTITTPLCASVVASPAWQCIELVSDLHLTPTMPRTAAAFERYLDQTQADAVFILGDLFEVWIGDDIENDAFASAMMQALRRTALRRTVAFMVGNRDFLMGPDFLASHGIVPLHDPTVLTAFGQRAVLSHGDALCLDDVDYQNFRLWIRSPDWRLSFLQKDRNERANLARSLRDASMASKPTEPVTWADADPAMTKAWLHDFDSDMLVHGHTHRPAKHVPAVEGASDSTVRHVLSDWDLDGTEPRAQGLQWRAEGVHTLSVSPFGPTNQLDDDGARAKLLRHASMHRLTPDGV